MTTWTIQLHDGRTAQVQADEITTRQRRVVCDEGRRQAPRCAGRCRSVCSRRLAVMLA